MKVVILAGGLGTRISEETSTIPKPMIEVGGQPILSHIMKIYSFYGFNDFVIPLGYKGHIIKDYFLNFHPVNSDISVKLSNGAVDYHSTHDFDWDVRMVDTGLHTMTGGRVARLRTALENDTFMLTYGDGVSDVNISELLDFHRSHGKLVTMTAVRPPARFGTMSFEGDKITEFKEKPQTGEGWINGGFFVCEPGIFDYLKDGDETVLEKAPLENIAKDGELMAYRHDGFWKCMDTLRDKMQLCELWDESKAPWKKW